MKNLITHKLAFMLAFIVSITTVQVCGQDMQPRQTVRGSVINQKTQQPVSGATIRIEETKLGAVSKADGSFKIANVPIGRYVLKTTIVGYEPYSSAFVVTSGKELVVKIELTETFLQTDEVVVDGNSGGFTAINEAAIVSSNVFSVDDAYRYAGSRGDPARMAQSFAGVLGVNDQRNDIIIRGGSPTELLWRIDGLDVPNPNHFATQGATGGPISVLNINLLDNSDFLTGAFPAEYGDKMSGVFDLRTRKGNADKFEYTGQFGFNGIELMGEGPTGFLNGSFMADYRYSFLGLMEKMGFKLGWTGVPEYQDANFKLDFQPTDKDQVSFTGLWGTSDIFLQSSTLDSVFTGDRDIKNGTDILSIAANWQHLFSETTYGKFTLGTVYGGYRTTADSITTSEPGTVLSVTPTYSNQSTEGYHTAKYRLWFAPDSRQYFSAGTELRMRYYDIDIKAFTTPFGSTESGQRFTMGDNGTTLHSLNYINWNWRITEDLTTNLGVHGQYLDISKKLSIEPRFAVNYRFAENQTVNFGTGIYRQSQPLTAYFATPDNNSLDFTQAVHFVGGYTLQPDENWLVKAEGYFKNYSNVPVERDKASAVSLLNAGANFGGVEVEVNLANNGKGRSYGSELTVMRHFAGGYYVTATASYVRQEFMGSDGVWRFGAFDNRYIGNLLAGYEWKVSPSFTIEFSGKYTYAGGAPYTPIDLVKSQERGRTMFDNSRPFSERNPDYSRLDSRIDFRNNFDGWSIISFVSVENMLNTKNVSFREYSPRKNTVEAVTQLGIFPIGGFKIEF